MIYTREWNLATARMMSITFHMIKKSEKSDKAFRVAKAILDGVDGILEAMKPQPNYPEGGIVDNSNIDNPTFVWHE